MRFLGIDPGYDRAGYAVIDEDLNIITSGFIQTNSEWKYWVRLGFVSVAIKDTIKQFRPAVAGMEKPFIGHNVSRGVEVAGAWAIIGMAIFDGGCDYMELTTTQVKAAVANGRATKAEVKAGVMLLLNLAIPPQYDDITDAMAVAICTRDKWQLERMLDQ